MKNQEKIFALILTISVLLNIRQCSDSKSFNDEMLIHEHELSETEKGLDDIKTEIVKLSNLLTKETKPTTPERVEVKKPTIKKPVAIKTVDSVVVTPSLIHNSDTTKTN